MKSLLLFIMSFTSFSAFAATNDGALVMPAPQRTESVTDQVNFAEFGFQYSSINDGSADAAIGALHEWPNGFALGFRALLPMSFTNQAQAYMGEIVSRFMILNEGDQMYVEPTVGYGYFNSIQGGHFTTIGAGFGYMHKFTRTLALSGLLGVDYSSSRVSGDTVISGSNVLYNKVMVSGSYYF